MRSLSNLEMVSLWEHGQRMHGLDRGLLALSQVTDNASWDQLADLPLGQRNRSLIELRAACFGRSIAGWVPCPACAEKLEFDFDSDTLQSPPQIPQTVTWEGRTFRLPTSRTLAYALQEQNPQQSIRLLLEASEQDPASPGEFAETEIAEIGDCMANADPLAYPSLAFVCTVCGTSWEEPLDLIHFLWTELEARVRRMLRDVHQLARAYGWSEATVLALSDRRRALYLEMVQP